MADTLTRRIYDLAEELPPEIRRPLKSGGKAAVLAARRLRSATAGVTRRAAERLDASGHSRAARMAFERATDLNESCHPAWLWLARSREREGDLGGALDAYTRALMLRPTMLAVYRRRALVLRALGDEDGATATLLAGYLFADDSTERARLREALGDADIDESAAMAMVLGSADPAVATATMSHLLRSADPDVIGEQLRRWTPILPPDVVRQAIEQMHRRGAIRASLVAARDAKSHHPSAWVDSFIARRASDVADLEAGIVELADRPAEPITPSGTVTALYLLHNSLPYQSGGYATRTQGLISGLESHGHRVIGVTRPGFPPAKGVFTQRRGIDETDNVDGVTYHRLISSTEVLPRKDLDAFADHYATLLRPLVERYRPSLIHAASNWWNGFGGIATARRAGLPFVYEVRGLWELTKGSREPEWSGSEAYLSDALREASVAIAADRVITLSAALRDELVGRGVDANKITLVPNAVDVDRFAPRDRDLDLAREVGIGNKLVIGFAGTITFYEGLDDLLRAIASLPLAARLRVVTVVVGSGPAQAGLEELAGELGLADDVLFIGRVPHAAMPRYLSLFDIVPFPRLPVPVCEIVPPIKPLEALSMEKAVVVSDVKALSEMVIDGETGLHFRKGDVGALRDALAALIDDPGLRTRLGTAAREWATAQRSWSIVNRSVADLYAELIDR